MVMAARVTQLTLDRNWVKLFDRWRDQPPDISKLRLVTVWAQPEPAGSGRRTP